MSLHVDQPSRRQSTDTGARALCALWLVLQTLGCGGAEQALGPTAKVEKGRLERLVVATGTIEPIREVEVRPRIAGIIEKIHVDAGDSVEPGQPLVEIERELLASQVREAEAALRWRGCCCAPLAAPRRPRSTTPRSLAMSGPRRWSRARARRSTRSRPSSAMRR